MSGFRLLFYALRASNLHRLDHFGPRREKGKRKRNLPRHWDRDPEMYSPLMLVKQEYQWIDPCLKPRDTARSLLHCLWTFHWDFVGRNSYYQTPLYERVDHTCHETVRSIAQPQYDRIDCATYCRLTWLDDARYMLGGKGVPTSCDVTVKHLLVMLELTCKFYPAKLVLLEGRLSTDPIKVLMVAKFRSISSKTPLGRYLTEQKFHGISIKLAREGPVEDVYKQLPFLSQVKPPRDAYFGGSYFDYINS